MKSPMFFSQLVIEPLDRLLSINESLHTLLTRESLSLLDSSMIIEDRFSDFQKINESNSHAVELKALDSIGLIEDIIETTRRNGFASTFHQLIEQFGLSMIDLFANQIQSDNVRHWLSQGIRGAYLMTDAGGPNINSWKTVYNAEKGTLQVNKVWGIEAHGQTEEYYLIVARKLNSFLPVNILLDPERSAQLNSRAVGLPFLDGRLQLGNVSGDVSVSVSDIPSQGSLTLMNNALSIARPRFVRAVLAHLLWLCEHNRLTLDPVFASIVTYLGELGEIICRQTQMDKNLVDSVLAYKLAANTLLLELVRDGQALNCCHSKTSDARDLLAFSKMEGSSYRCFLELYNHRKNRRMGS